MNDAQMTALLLLARKLD